MTAVKIEPREELNNEVGIIKTCRDGTIFDALRQTLAFLSRKMLTSGIQARIS